MGFERDRGIFLRRRQRHPVAWTEVGQAAGTAEEADAGAGGKSLGIGREAPEGEADLLLRAHRRLSRSRIGRFAAGDRLQDLKLRHRAFQGKQRLIHDFQRRDLILCGGVAALVDRGEGRPGGLQCALRSWRRDTHLGLSQCEPVLPARLVALRADQLFQRGESLCHIAAFQRGAGGVAGLLLLVIRGASGKSLTKHGGEAVRVGLQAGQRDLVARVALRDGCRDPQREADARYKEDLGREGHPPHEPSHPSLPRLRLLLTPLVAALATGLGI